MRSFALVVLGVCIAVSTSVATPFHPTISDTSSSGQTCDINHLLPRDKGPAHAAAVESAISTLKPDSLLRPILVGLANFMRDGKLVEDDADIFRVVVCNSTSSETVLKRSTTPQFIPVASEFVLAPMLGAWTRIAHAVAVGTGVELPSFVVGPLDVSDSAFVEYNLCTDQLLISPSLLPPAHLATDFADAYNGMADSLEWASQHIAASAQKGFFVVNCGGMIDAIFTQVRLIPQRFDTIVGAGCFLCVALFTLLGVPATYVVIWIPATLICDMLDPEGEECTLYGPMIGLVLTLLLLPLIFHQAKKLCKCAAADLNAVIGILSVHLV